MLMLATAASAGPWPREPKALFLSLSVEADRNDNSYVGLYGEYGLSPRRTLGFELGHASIGETSAMIWLQQARGDGSGANRWVTSLGLGGFERDGDLVPVVQIGAAWGRGIDWLPGGGWITVESRVKVAGKQQEIEPEPEENVVYEGDALTYLTPQVTTKLEATLGFRPFTGMMLINQLRLEDRDDTGLSGKLASSVVRDLAGPAKIELGLVLPLAGDGEAAVKLGSWLEF
ncbi:hypothetical protein IT41_04370 [Paracoccus halophilus]|uniref:Uncharacterized protein n=1 Tax=Paracoccus halophilus TaxID=376733 RepID=A0A099F598_9RHOB|nr:hypothetical protein IT41_04370 [Paracoccus halophilus]